MNAECDRLTGLLNLPSGLTQLEQAVAEAKQQRTTLAVLFADIEHFSDLNCCLGHLAGDAVLCQLAERCQRIVADKGTVCRFARDEFFIVLPSALAGEAEEIGERVAKQTVNVEGHVVHLTLTIGVASYPADGLDGFSLLRVAEEAAPPTKWCRRAKEAGEEVRVDGEIS